MTPTRRDFLKLLYAAGLACPLVRPVKSFFLPPRVATGGIVEAPAPIWTASHFTQGATIYVDTAEGSIECASFIWHDGDGRLHHLDQALHVLEGEKVTIQVPARRVNLQMDDMGDLKVTGYAV